MNHVLAGHVAGVGDGDGHGVSALRLVIGHGVQRLLKRGVAQAIAEGVAHFLGVVPAVGAVEGPGRAVGTSGAHHRVLISGLVVLVAHVDALGIDNVIIDVLIAVDLVVLIEFIGVAPGHNALYAAVDHRGGGDGAGGVGIHRLAGGVDLTGQHICDGSAAVGAGHAGEQAGVHAVLLQEAQFHLELRGEDHYDLAEHTGRFLVSQIGNQSLLIGGQVQHPPGRSIGIGVIAGVLVHIVALASVAGDDHHGRVVIVALPGALVGNNSGDVRLGHAVGPSGA